MRSISLRFLSLLHGAQATGTYGDSLGSAADRNLYLADVGLPTSVGLAVGVRNVLTEHNAFVADAAFCHIDTSLYARTAHRSFNEFS